MKMIGEFQFQVLRSIMALGSEAYGREIRHYLTKVQNKETNYGAVYTTLSRLEEAGLISHEIKAAEKKRGGRAKKRFSVTADGEKAYRNRELHLRSMLAINEGSSYA